MKLGAEPKKVVLLGGLVVFGLYLLYSNVISSPSSGPEPARRAGTVSRTNPDLTDLSESPVQPNIRRAGSRARSTEEFRPTLGHRRGEEKIDPLTIDPTLRFDLLAKVQAVEMQGGSRNLFAFSTPPPPPLPKDEPQVPIKKVFVGPVQPAAPPGPPPTPPPPPILLKYYGYSNARGESKHAFFLDGDDILVAAEGETVKRRYKVVRIGVNSVVMEDTESKHEQTLPLQAEAAG